MTLKSNLRISGLLVNTGILFYIYQLPLNCCNHFQDSLLLIILFTFYMYYYYI